MALLTCNGKDRTIVTTAIPKITDRFHSLQDVGWYGSAYLLTGASSNLLFGRIYKFYPTKWVFLGSVLIFEIGSLVCGTAPTSVAFVIGRAIAGLGSSGVQSGGIMILVPMVPLRKRPLFGGLFGAALAISSSLGPLIGGAITDRLGWRWCFYINLPVGGFTVLAMALGLRIDKPEKEHPTLLVQISRLDPIGTFFFVSSTVCLVLALQWGGTTLPWSDPRTIATLVVFGVMFLAFCGSQILRPTHATIPSNVIRQRSIIGGVLFAFMQAGSMLLVTYFLPIWFQAVRGDSAEQSGISTIPMVLSQAVMAVLSSGFTQKIGYYVPAMFASSILASVAAGLLSTISPVEVQSRWIGYECLYGFGTGLASQTAALAVQTVLPKSDISTGIALILFAQQLGGAIFVSVGENVLTSTVIARLSNVVGLDAQAISDTGMTDIRNSVPPQYLPLVVNAFNYGVTRTFLVAVGLSVSTFLASLVMEWKDIKKAKAKQR